MNRPERVGSLLFTRRRQFWVRLAVGTIVVLTLLFTVHLYGVDGIPYLPTHDDGTDGNEKSQKASFEKDLGGPRSPLPHKIWQIMLPKGEAKANQPVDPEHLPDTLSWISMNPDYAYTLIGPGGGEEFVKQHFSHDKSILETYQNLTHVGMKPDLLRYLILSVEGGVYTDTDTVALKPIDLWIPEKFRDKARVVVGLEFDQRDDGTWADITHTVQFCQWTLAAFPGHPVFPRMVDHVVKSVKKLSEKYQVPLSELKPTSLEVMEATAPAAWTDVLFKQLQEYDPSLKSTGDFSYMTKPKLYGDILILPIDAFGMGQPHSHSTNDGSIPKIALARHLFRGSWRD